MMPMGFEFGFRKPLHVVHTTPADWEKTDVDLTSYIAKVNAIKKGHAVFHEESPTSIFPCQNPNILLMWKASVKHKDEALLILNKDPHQHQEFSHRPLPALRPGRRPAARCLPGASPRIHSRAVPLRPASRPGHRAGDLAKLRHAWGRATAAGFGGSKRYPRVGQASRLPSGSSSTV